VLQERVEHRVTTINSGGCNCASCQAQKGTHPGCRAARPPCGHTPLLRLRGYGSTPRRSSCSCSPPGRASGGSYRPRTRLCHVAVEGWSGWRGGRARVIACLHSARSARRVAGFESCACYRVAMPHRKQIALSP